MKALLVLAAWSMVASKNCKKNHPGKRTRTMWGNGTKMYDNLDDDDDDDDDDADEEEEEDVADDDVADDDVEDDELHQDDVEGDDG